MLGLQQINVHLLQNFTLQVTMNFYY